MGEWPCLKKGFLTNEEKEGITVCPLHQGASWGSPEQDLALQLPTSVANWKNSLALGLPLRTLMLWQSQKPPNIWWLLPLQKYFEKKTEPLPVCWAKHINHPRHFILPQILPHFAGDCLAMFPFSSPHPHPRRSCPAQSRQSEKLSSPHTPPEAWTAYARALRFFSSLG